MLNDAGLVRLYGIGKHPSRDIYILSSLQVPVLACLLSSLVYRMQCEKEKGVE